MAGQRRLQRRSRLITLASSFVLVGSLGVAGGYELHREVISPVDSSGSRTEAALTPSGSPTGVGDRAAPNQSDGVADDVSTSSTPSPSPSQSTGPAEEPDPRSALESSVIKLTNAERKKEGCTSSLRTDSRLRTAARKHSADMARRDYFSHESPDGTSPWDRAEAAGYTNPSAENIAHGYPTAKSVVAAWMASSGHRKNILNCDSKAVGVGVYLGGDGGPFWTQMFGYT
ncbi:MAG: CAP domain-containing protein [Sporichthyaceae bacterium]|nr:CAP domain-containing protein [Sporichthyaceae bacterium]